jgi:hypothetical protein
LPRNQPRRNRVKYIFLICLYTIPFFAHSQNISKEVDTIRGHLFRKEDTSEVWGAKISLEITSVHNTYLTTTTDKNGEFIFSVPDSLIRKRFKIRVNYVGFKEKVIIIKKEQLPINDLKISITPFEFHDYFE